MRNRGKQAEEERKPVGEMWACTCSFEAAVIVETFGAVLRSYINGDIEDLVVVVVVVVHGGSVLTHLATREEK